VQEGRGGFRCRPYNKHCLLSSGRLKYAGMQSNDPNKSLGFLIYEVSRLLRRNFDQRVQSLGLTQAQWRAIAHIAHNEGCNQITLAEILEVKPITLSRLLDRLQAAGWVERRADPEDRRATRLYLNEKARPLVDKMAELAMQTRRQALAGMSVEEHHQLFALLKMMKSNLCE
jgi:MarR family transcriptional regulator, transcriptional regulator for hemolysin